MVFVLRVMRCRSTALFAIICAVACDATQVVLNHDADTVDAHSSSASRRVMTPEFKQFVQEIIERYDVPGLSLGVLHGGEVELGAWGRRTEDNDPMTEDVSARHSTSLIVYE